MLQPIDIRATDNDATAEFRNFTYSLIGDYADLFTIDPYTAKVRVSDYGMGRLDREDSEFIYLKVKFWLFASKCFAINSFDLVKNICLGMTPIRGRPRCMDEREGGRDIGREGRETLTAIV